MSVARLPASPPAPAAHPARRQPRAGRRAPALRPVSLAVCLLGVTPLGLALPEGARPTQGQVTVQTTAPGQMLIQQGTARAGLDWTSFSIAAGERVQVVQPDRSSVLLNRVLGENPSLIYGALQSNGSVWLINPRGIVFGAGSRVDVGGLVASTLTLSDEALASGRLQLGVGAGGAGELRSEGQITAIDGTVALVAPQLFHSGQIEARRVALAAASEVLVDVEGDGLVFFNVKNEGLDTRLQVLGGVRADGGSAEFRAAARAGFADTVLNLDGVVQARSLGQLMGRIVVDGGDQGITQVAGRLDATGATGRGGDVLVQGHKILLTQSTDIDTSGEAGGGRLRVGGGFQGRDDGVRNASMVSVARGARLSANATGQGDGGELIVWSDHATRFFGSADSRGGARGGNGGLVEVSGKAFLDFRGTSDRSAPLGLAGLLLLDPGELTIRAADPDVNGNGGGIDLDAFDLGPGQGATLGFADGGATSFITAGQVATQMLDGDVVLQATENINVNASITSASGFSLRLFAGKSINITQPIDVTGGITLSVNDPGAGASSSSSAIADIAAGLTAGDAITITNNGGTGVHRVAANLTATSLSLTGGIEIAGPSVWTLSGTQALANPITGSGALQKAGAGVLTLSNAAGYDGALTVAQGGLTLGGALGSTAVNVSGGTLTTTAIGQLNSSADITVGSGTLTLGGTNTVGTLNLGGTLAGSTLTTTGATTLTNNAVVNGGLNAASLTSSGTTEVNAAIAVSGTTEVTGGTLTLRAALTSGTVLLSGGSLSTTAADLLLNTANLTVSSGTLTLGGTNTVATLNLGGTLAGSTLTTTGATSLTNNAVVNGGLNAASLTSSGSTAVNGPTTVSGTTAVSSGTLTLDGALNANTINVNGGTLVLSTNASLNGTADIFVAGGATLSMGRAASIDELRLAGTVTGTNVLTVENFRAQETASTPRIESTVAVNNNAVVDDGVTLTLAGSGSNGGALRAAGTLSVAGTVVNGRSDTVSTSELFGTGAIGDPGQGVRTLRHTGSNALTIDKNLAGLQLIESLGSGGATLITGGNLGSSATLTVAAGTTFTLDAANTSVATLNLSGTLAGTGTLTASAGAFVPANASATLSGNLTANVTVGSNAGLSLGASSGFNSNNDITVDSGATLTLATATTVRTLTLGGTLAASSSVLTATSATVPVGTTGTLNGLLNASTINVLGALVTGGADRIANTNNVAVGNGASYTLGGDETIASLTLAGTLSGNSFTLTATGGSTLENNATVATGATLSGGTLTVAGAATMNGRSEHLSVEILSTGNLSLGTTADRLNNSADVNNAGLLTLSRNEQIGILRGEGDVIENGFTLSTTTTVINGTNSAKTRTTVETNNLVTLGSVRITGTAAVTNAVNVQTGTLTIGSTNGNTGSLSAGGTITVDAGATLAYARNNSAGNINLAGTYTGAGTFTNNNTANLVIDGTLGTANVVASGGNITLAAGSNDRLLDTANVTVAAGRTLTLNNVSETLGALTLSGTLAGAGSLTTSSTSVPGGASAALNAALSTTSLSVPNTATLTLGANAQATTLSLGGTLAGGGFTLTTTGAATLSNGALVNSGLSAASLSASGTTRINGASAVSGTTTVTGGTLTLGGTLAADTILLSGGNLSTTATNLLADTANITVNSGTLTLGGADTVSTLALGGTLGAGSTLTTSGTTTLNDNAVVNGGLNAASLTASGSTQINAATAVAGTTQVTSGTLMLSAALASNSVQLNGGNLTTTAANLLADGATVTVPTGRTLSLGGNDSITLLNLSGTLTGSGTLTATDATAGYVLTGGRAQAPLGSGVLSASGSSSLAAAAAVNNVTILGGGTLTLDTGSSFSATPAFSVAGTLSLVADMAIGSLAGNGAVDLGSFTLTTGSGGSTSFGGVISGSGNLTKLGAGTTFTLSGANTYTGLTTVSAGTLALGANEVLANTSSVNVGGSGTLALGNNGTETITNLTLSGALTGAGTASLTAANITLSGGGTDLNAALVATTRLTATGISTLNGTLDGNLRVSSGTLTLVGGSRLVNAAASVDLQGGTLVLNGNESVASSTLAGTLNGPGVLTATTHTLQNGAQINTNLAGAGLVVSGAATLVGQAQVSTVTVNNGGNLTLASTADRIAGTAVTVNSGGQLTLTSDQAASALSLAGTLAGTGHKLTAATTLKTGASVLANLGGSVLVVEDDATLTGTADSTAVQITGGTLTLAAANRLASGTSVNVSAGASLLLGGNQTLAALSGTGTVDVGSATLTLAPAVDSSFSGRLSGSTTGSLVKETAGIVFTLEGDGSGFAGAVRVEAGTLALSTGTLGARQVDVNSGTLSLGDAERLSNTATVNVASGATLTLANTETVDTLNLNGLLSGAGTLNAATVALNNATVSANLGGGSLRSLGNSVLNRASAATTLAVNGGTLTLAGTQLLTGAPVTTVSGVTTTLALQGATTLGSLAGDGTVALGSATLSTGSAAGDTSFTGLISGSGGLVKQGGSIFTLGAGQTYTGGTTVLAGTLATAASNGLADTGDVTVASGATWSLGGNDTVRQLTLAGTLAGSGTLTASAGYRLTGGTVNTPLGAGALVASGNSTLAAASGVTSVVVEAGGVLTLGPTATFGTDAAVTLNGTSRLALGSHQTFGSLAGSGELTLGSFTLSTGNGGDSSFTGLIAGTGGLTKQGSSVFTLGGSHSYTGATLVAAGTLALQTDNVLPDGSAVTVATPATLALGGIDTVASLTLSGTLGGTGTLTAASYAFNTGAATLGTAQLGLGTLTVNGNSQLAGTAAGNVVVDSGVLSLAAANRLADGAQVTVRSAGTLALAGDDTVGTLTLAGRLSGSGQTLSATTTTLESGARVDANLAGTTLNVAGDSALNGSANTTRINVNGGVLTLGSAERLGDGSELRIANSATLLLGGTETVDTLTVAGTLGSAGRLLQAGRYTLEDGAEVHANLGTGPLASTGSTLLAGTSAASTVHVDGGVMRLGSGDLLADTATVRVADGATLRLNGNDTVLQLQLAGSLDGIGTLTASVYALSGGTYDTPLGGGELTVSGNSRLNATSAATIVNIEGGTLTLGAANRFTEKPAVTVSANAGLVLGGDESFGSLAGAGNIDLQSFTLTHLGLAASSFTGSIRGSGGLSKEGNDTFTLGGSHSYTGLTRLDAGTLTLSGTLASGTVQVVGGTLALTAAERLADTAALNVGSAGRLTLAGNEAVASLVLAGTLDGTGTLSAATVELNGGRADANLGAGTLRSTGNSQLNGSSAAGVLAVDGGTLTLGAAQRLTASPVTTVAGTATLLLLGDQILGSLAGTGNVDLGSAVLSTGSAGDSSYSGTLSGTGGLNKLGSSRFTVGGSQLYTGATRVLGGQLITAAANVLPDASALEVANGSTLTLGGSDTVASLVLAGTLAGSGTLSASSYTLAGGTADAALGAGTLLSSGSSRLNAGSAAATVQVTGGTLTLGAAQRLADAAAVTVARDATLALGGDDTVGSLALAGTLAGSGTLTAASYALDGARVDANLGAGVLSSTGSSTLAGSAAALQVQVSGGTLTLAAADRLADAAQLTVARDATLRLAGNDTVGTLTLAGTLEGSGTLTAGSYALDGARVEAALGAGTLSSTGNSTLGAGSAAGSVVVNGGSLTLAGGSRLAAAPATTVASGATLRLSGNETLGTLAGAGTVELAGFTLSTGSGGDSRFDGVISGLAGGGSSSGSLVKLGASTFTLGGANTYGGSTLVQAGSLATAGADVLPDTSATTVDAGATLALGGNDRIGSLQLAGRLQGSALLTAAAYTLDGGTVVADLGTGRLVSTGNSRLDGSAAASEVAVDTGTLTLGAANRLADGAAVAVAPGATLVLGGDDTVGSLTLAGTLAGNGALRASTVALNSGRAEVALIASSLASRGNSRLDGTLRVDNLAVEAGTLTLGSAQRLAGPAALTLAAGSTLVLGGDETLGSLAGEGDLNLGAFTLGTGSAGSSRFDGTLSGSGALVKQGSSNFTLGGAQAYTGATTVDGGTLTLLGTLASGALQVNTGTLALANADRLADSATVAVASGAALTLAGNDTVASLTLAGELSGTGTLNAANVALNGGTARADLGAGSLRSSGNSRLEGRSAATTVQVDSGTLSLAAADRLADSAAVTVATGASLVLGGADTIGSLALAGTLGGSGTLTAANYLLEGATVIADLGTGTLRSSGSSRLDGRASVGTLAVEGGSFTLGAADRLADTTALSVASGATLVLASTDTIASLVLAGTYTGGGTLTAASYLLDGGRAEANLGTGSLTVRGASTLAGTAGVQALQVEGGTLTLASAQRLSALPAVQVAGGAALALAGDQTFGSLAGAGNVDLGSFTLSTGSGGDSVFAGVVSGSGSSGGLVKQGSSIFTLTGANTYTGATRVAAGTLRVGDGGSTGSLATSAFEVTGALSFARSDTLPVAQPISGSGTVEQAGSGRLLFSGNNKSYTGSTTVTRGELATASADELPDGSDLRVLAAGSVALGGRETVRTVDADGAMALGTELVATGDLLMRGAVSAPGALRLSGQRIEAPNAGNRFGGTLSLDARGAINLASGTENSVPRSLVLGTVNAADGGRIESGVLSLTGATTVTGGTLSLVASAPLTAVEPDDELLNRQATSLPIAFAADVVAADATSRINVAAGAGLRVLAPNGGSVQLLQAANSFLGELSVLSGTPDSPWSANSTTLSFNGATTTYALQSRLRIEGGTVNIGGDGLLADVVRLRADRVATVGDAATIVARLPFDSTAGTSTALPALTLELTPAAFGLSFPFGAPGAGGLRVDVGSRAYGNRTLPLDAGFVTVLPRDGARGSTAVLLQGPVVNPAGGYRFFFDGAGSQTQIPVFYNGSTPTTPQVENSISATVAVSEGARKAGFDDAVRTENVAVRLRAGVIAEVGPAPAATQGTEGLRVPSSCAPAAGALLCGPGN